MITSILKYEIKNRLAHWSIFLLYGLLIFQGFWYTKGTFDYYVNEDLKMNAPAIFYKNLAGCGILMVIIVAVITESVLFKEIQYKTGQWLFTNPIDEKKFFLGRFLAALSINALVALGYLMGMLLVPYVGIGEAHLFGPSPMGQLLHGYLFLLLPNLFLLTSLIFFALVYFRKIAAGYLFVIVTVITFLLMQTTAENSGATPLLLLADPFGYVAVENAIEYMPVNERNFGYLKFTDYLFINRIVWLGFSLLLVRLAYKKFTFKHFLITSNSKKISKNEKDETYLSPSLKTINIKPDLAFSSGAFLKKLFSLSALEIKNVVRPSGFKITIGIVILMNVLQNLLWNASYYIGPTEPLTFTMTAFRLSFGVFIMILLMVWAGELFFKDRTVNFWQIADTLPVPVWTVTLSRFFAMAIVGLILAATFMTVGMLVQVVKGGIGLIDLKLYAYDLLGYNWGWLTYVMQIALVFFIAGLTKNRIATHIISVGILFLTLMAFELGLAEQTIYAYAAVPGLEDYSEISGYGIWTITAKWYFLMWALLACCFILFGIWFWQRGSRSSLRSFSLFNKQLSGGGKVLLVILLAGFTATRLHIINEVNGKGNFTLSEEEEKKQAHYEKKYGYLKSNLHPKYKVINLKFDYFPEERKAVYTADITLNNSRSSDTLYLSWADFVDVQQVSIEEKKVEPVYEDAELRVTAYLIPNTSDSLISLNLKAQKQYTGFSQSGENPQPDLMFNGSFGNIKEFLPTIGYNYTRELKENRKRTDQGLSKLNSRMAPISDSIAIQQDGYSPDAERVKGSIKISTSKSQKAIAPGILVNEWSENGRNYYQFEIKNPQPFNWHLGTANYELTQIVKSEVSIQIYFDPKHPFNILIYEEAASKAVSFIQENFVSFPTQQLRIYEIPYYQNAFYSFPNAIAISEKEGWYAKTDRLDEKAYIYQTVASQLMRQWINKNIKVANVQGADMIKVALPEALALTFVEKELGKKSADIILKKKNDKYAKDKNSEANTEPPLLYADGADYLEQNKGAIVLYETIQEIGFEKFKKELLNWSTRENSMKIFKDLLTSLRPLLKTDTYNKYLTE